MTGNRRSRRAVGTAGGWTRALATAALLTFGAACAFAADSDSSTAQDAAAKPAATAAKAPAKTEPAPAAAKPAETTAKEATAAKDGSAKPAVPATAAPAKALKYAKPVATKDLKTAAPKTAAAVGGTTPVATAGAKAAAKPAEGAIKTASAPATGSKAKAPAAAKAANVQPQEDRVTYHYNALGRRDPFKPLVEGFVAADEGGDAPPDVGGISVVGIVWGADDKFALVEDARGNSMVLRRGDKVMNGVVEGLKRESLIVKITVDGQSQSVEIPLMRKGDDHDNQ